MTKIGYVDIAWMYHGEASVINGSISTGVGGGLGLMRKYKGDLTSWYYVGSSAIGVWNEKTEQIDELALVSLGYRFQTNGVTRGNWMGLEISKPIAPFHVLNGQEISYRYSGYYLISKFRILIMCFFLMSMLNPISCMVISKTPSILGFTFFLKPLS